MPHRLASALSASTRVAATHAAAARPAPALAAATNATSAQLPTSGTRRHTHGPSAAS